MPTGGFSAGLRLTRRMIQARSQMRAFVTRPRRQSIHDRISRVHLRGAGRVPRAHSFRTSLATAKRSRSEKDLRSWPARRSTPERRSPTRARSSADLASKPLRRSLQERRSLPKRVVAHGRISGVSPWANLLGNISLAGPSLPPRPQKAVNPGRLNGSRLLKNAAGAEPSTAARSTRLLQPKGCSL